MRTEAALRGARNFRRAHVPKSPPHLMPASRLERFSKEAKKLKAQAGIFFNALGDKTDYYHPPVNQKGREWVNMITTKAEKMHTRGNNLQLIGKARAKEVMGEIVVSPTLITGFAVDSLMMVLLMVNSFKPITTRISDWIMLGLWWASGAVVLMFDMEMDPITAIYALSQIPTTIGFGDYCPDTPALKLFQALHIWISTAAISGQMYEYVDDALTWINGVMNKKKSARVTLMITTAELIIEMTASIFFYAWEFGYDGSENGFALDMLDAIYFTVVAISTVGYGDFSPSTNGGKGASIPWQFFATHTMGRFSDSMERLRSPYSNRTSRRSGARRTAKMRPVLIKDPETGQAETIMTNVHTEDLAKIATATTTEVPQPPGVMQRVRAVVSTGKALTTTFIKTTTTVIVPHP